MRLRGHVSRVATLEPGMLVGEIAFLRERERGGGGGGGGRPQAASATVVVERPGAELVRWRRGALLAYLEAHPDVGVAFERALSRDLSRKITRNRREARRLI